MSTFAAYTTIRYRFLGQDNLDGALIHLTCAEDIPEGSVVSINPAGLAKNCALAEIPVGVAPRPCAAGMELTVETNSIIEQKGGTSLALTVGGRVYNAAGGTVSSTQGAGASPIGVAMTANKVRVLV